MMGRGFMEGRLGMSLIWDTGSLYREVRAEIGGSEGGVEFKNRTL
jgi:hypothetical protein